ncbi:Gti1/Pac2 family-domain-containing protein [Mycena rebaudengoi]|nr:Gti1/Pac2 family-domain-containing protein [Mycena rebaudengoi]
MSSSLPTDIPPFYGAVETTMNALRLIHAARQGVIPRITPVFVFSVEESGIKRWTDGLLWSPSRIVGNFLVYREINEANKQSRQPQETLPHRRTIQGHASNTERFKPNGLIKKVNNHCNHRSSDLHLISYYTSSDQHSGKLKRPTSRPDIMNLPMDPRLFRATNFRVPPKVEKAPDGTSRLV